MHRFDIVLLSDFRFSGGTSAAVAEEIRAAHGAGYSVGLVALEAANLTTPLPLHPRRHPRRIGRCAPHAIGGTGAPA